MAGAQIYDRKVINRSGYTLFLPRVATVADILSSIVDPYTESSIKLFPIGTIAQQGREFYSYCKAAATAISTLGTPIQGAARVHAEQDDDIVVGAAAAIGAYTVELTSTANLDDDPNDDTDDFAGGWLIVNDAAGEGQLYQIKSNEGFSGTADATFTLFDPLTIALTTSSQVGLVRAPGYRVIATAAPLTGPFMGVPLIAVTASYYFWAKFKGYVPGVATGSGGAVGDMAVVGETAAKFDDYDAATATQRVVGQFITPQAADTESSIIDLF